MDALPPEKKGPHLINEADVGSGEKSPGQADTEELIARIGERDQATGEGTDRSMAGENAVDPDRAVAPPGAPPRPADSTSAGPP